MSFCTFQDAYALFDCTPLENLFIQEYMLRAPGDHVKVYLYGFLLIETVRHGRYRKQHDIHAGIFQCGSPAFGMYASGIGNHQYFHNSMSAR